ncbi:hypothetical protein HUJ05_004071 [Dendroctonus ponderosae]|nr:hypothetical protein HUJ05_004071 [Dendroctonus ponderosae]
MKSIEVRQNQISQYYSRFRQLEIHTFNSNNLTFINVYPPRLARNSIIGKWNILEIFSTNLNKNNIVLPVILFVDGHTTHLTLQLFTLTQRESYSRRMFLLSNPQTMWKKGEIDWRREHPTESLSREKLAPILEKILPKLKADSIANGFRVCGLFPWNPDAVDYSKCLGKTMFYLTHVKVVKY